MGCRIMDIKSREILDSRGNPTIETDCILESGIMGRGDVPSGASTGKLEALELRDNDENRYKGKGVLKAIKNVKNIIAPEIIGKECLRQKLIDFIMCEQDGTDNKSNLGANAILSVSMAVARASANFLGIPLFRYLGGANSNILPVPLCNVINGGVHSDNNLDVQEFMIVPYSMINFSESIRCASEIFHTLKKILNDEKYRTGVGDEGGFTPDLRSNEDALKFLVKAIEISGFKPYEEVGIALDVAASGFYKNGKYSYEEREIDSDKLIRIYEDWVEKYPIVSIEDGLGESDWEGWKSLNNTLGDKIQIVGDDIFVTNTEIIRKGIYEEIANSVLIKLNQIGTVSETIEAIEVTKENGWNAIISHRSGETSDVFISHLSVGLNTGQIKTGSLSRSDRVEKYNELIRIEEELGDVSEFKGKEVFS